MFDSAAGEFVDAQFRNLGLMFQSYALWPHMSVTENLAFPCAARHPRRCGAEADRRYARARRDGGLPRPLSGRALRRPAAARGAGADPRLRTAHPPPDEPLSNLDAKLRIARAHWLRELQRRTGVTTIYVTHDQTEALGLSDRIVVMNGGRIAQVGTPKDIYERPQDVFVADFIGAANLLSAEIDTRSPGGCRVRLKSGVVLDVVSPDDGGGRIVVAIRPERVRIVDGDDANVVAGVVVATEYHGALNVLTVDIGGERVRVETPPTGRRGRSACSFPPTRCGPARGVAARAAGAAAPSASG